MVSLFGRTVIAKKMTFDPSTTLHLQLAALQRMVLVRYSRQQELRSTAFEPREAFSAIIK